MTIVPMRRITLCGRAADKDRVVEELQALGVVHLIPLRVPEALAPTDAADRRRAVTAFRHIRDAPQRMRPYRPTTPLDVNAVIAAISANRRRLRELSDRRDALTVRIRDLAPWGSFRLPPLEQRGGERLWFYRLPLKHRAALDRLELPWAIVERDPTTFFVAVVSVDEPPADLLPVPRTHTGAVPLDDLKAELEDVEIASEKAEMERVELTRWRVLLGANLAAAEDGDARREASGQTFDAESLFAIQGWAPASAVPDLERIASDVGAALIAEAPGAGDNPPTLLQTADPRLGGGGDLTNFYMSPSYRSWDPSIVVLFSFAIFFAMILADAGYALLIGLITAAMWRRMGQTSAGWRFRIVLAVIVVASFIYGVAAGSYFGVPPPKGSLLAKLAVVNVTNFNAMMRLSVIIGAVHVGIALGTVAWMKRGTPDAIASLGWMGVILGGLLMWLGEGWVGTLGPIVLVVGLAAVFLSKALQRPVAKPTDWLLRLTDGFIGLTGITKLFGDILSYLRLFALGLASASLASTFNHMAANLELSRPGLGLLLSILILLVGHAINFAIGIMGGVVHGLRLNYIEFFGWGLSDEGYPFRAFAKREAPE